MVKTKIISAFPGTGKSHYMNNSYSGVVLDSDSSLFDKSGFPNNYIQHIKNCIGTATTILVSTHKAVRDALVREGIPYTLVYPHKGLKDEYVRRYQNRGSVCSFISNLSNNWDEWLNELRDQKGCDHIELNSGEYLGDVINNIKQ